MASITWATLKAQIQRKLDDTAGKKFDPDTLLVDCVNDALAAFAATHTGVASNYEITGDGTTYVFDLPSDIVDEEGSKVVAVHWKQSVWLTELEYWPGRAWPSTSATTTSNPLGYVLWPTGKIRFSRIPVTSQVVTLHYVGHYPTVTGDSSVITVPRWAREAIKYHACASALDGQSIKASTLGQYKSRMEAGDPEDNPVLQQARYFMRRYYDILAAHPTPQYDKLFPVPGRYE